jgi:hypothetical protein
MGGGGGVILRSGKYVSNYIQIIRANCWQELDIVYVVPEGQIIQLPTRIVGQFESEKIYLFHVFLTATATQ